MKKVITASSVQFEPGETLATITYQRDGGSFIAKVKQVGAGLLMCPRCGEAVVALQPTSRGLVCARCAGVQKRHDLHEIEDE